MEARLVERAKKVHSFAHLTFQEYFTACYIVENLHDEEAPINLKKLVTEHLYDERWKEVFSLVAGLMIQADELLVLICQINDRLFDENKDISLFRDQVFSRFWISEGKHFANGIAGALEIARSLIEGRNIFELEKNIPIEDFLKILKEDPNRIWVPGTVEERRNEAIQDYQLDQVNFHLQGAEEFFEHFTSTKFDQCEIFNHFKTLDISSELLNQIEKYFQGYLLAMTVFPYISKSSWNDFATRMLEPFWLAYSEG